MDGGESGVICGWGRGWQRVFFGFVLFGSVLDWLWCEGWGGICGGEVLSIKSEVEERVAVLVIEGVLVAIEEFSTIFVVASGW